ncbi:acyl carrier protein [Paenibacillus thiaminolyticus]|uniref:acyl carrier protein n=1 Tax=Paenibacillus thiaminolyticus TaxID=49283 RepID=UPI001162D8AA|nr:acyl carrier protein [Paenibacillus thiaminolyticus]NGP60485.1 acyl carrier protein [Paenibacillus thiaminolyticus]WCR25878.1 acyl carrier protein [Paenibacillus thiaminolyticus]
MVDLLIILHEIRPEFDFTQSDDYITDGLFDSFDIISLVSMIEEQYKVLIDALDIVPENFSSIEAITNLIRKNGGTV